MKQNRIAVKNVVLVHGGFVDGSGWEGVYKTLKRDGYTVAILCCSPRGSGVWSRET